jgi:hypothetical protein
MRQGQELQACWLIQQVLETPRKQPQAVQMFVASHFHLHRFLPPRRKPRPFLLLHRQTYP